MRSVNIPLASHIVSYPRFLPRRFANHSNPPPIVSFHRLGFEVSNVPYLLGANDEVIS